MNKQLNECAPSEDSDQPGSPQSDQSLYCTVRSKGSFFMQTAKTLIKLADGQADLSLQWMHNHFVLVLSRYGSNLCYLKISM